MCAQCASIECNIKLSVSGVKCFFISYFFFFSYFYSVSARGYIKNEMAGRKKSITHIKLMVEIGKFKI